MQPYDLNDIEHNETLCWDQATGEEILRDGGDPTTWRRLREYDEPTFRRLRPITQALILAGEHLGITEITTDNFEEWIYRLDLAFDSGMAFMHAPSPDGQVPIRLRAQDVLDHVGLRVFTKRMSDDAYHGKIITLRKSQISNAVGKLPTPE